MAIRKIANMGHPVLRQIAEAVPENKIKTPEFQQFLRDMAETMFEYDGRGLAAPQIHESVQVLVMLWDFEDGKDPGLRYLINPVIQPLTEETSSFWEGCLSVPGLRGFVERPNKISVKALNQKGEKLDFTAVGFAATVIQHECDHLIGKLYVDHIKDTTKFAFNKEFGLYHAKAGEETDQGGTD